MQTSMYARSSLDSAMVDEQEEEKEMASAYWVFTQSLVVCQLPRFSLSLVFNLQNGGSQRR